jgi:hypothetical protein
MSKGKQLNGQIQGDQDVLSREETLRILSEMTRTDGGASWSTTLTVSPLNHRIVAGGLRAPPFPSAEVDRAGNVYVVWQDCRFRSDCSSNDLVLSKSADGLNWTPPTRVPIDPVDSGADHFIPGLAVDTHTARRSRTARPHLLRLPGRRLHPCHLRAERRLHLLRRRRVDLELANRTGRTDEPRLAPGHQPGGHGGRLHLDLVHARARLPLLRGGERAQAGRLLR